jgi:hypothetical protein
MRALPVYGVIASRYKVTAGLMFSPTRRIRYGRPIVVVSGLPRSGTSLMMQMLGAGGLPLMTDETHVPDAANPAGYFELEAVNDLEKGCDLSWLEVTRGHAVKVFSRLLVCLPETYNYRVILMHRSLREVIASQGAVPTSALIAEYEAHLAKVRLLLATQPCFDTLIVDYGEVIADPRAQARRVRAFADWRLSIERMAAAVREPLYQHRLARPSSLSPSYENREAYDYDDRLRSTQAATAASKK